MRVVVAIPWRAAPGREKWLGVVKRHYSTHFPDWDLILVDSGDETFSRAKSRNLAVRNAAAKGADVVVINDADVLARSASIRSAAEGAAKGGLHLPFESCVVYSSAQAEAFAQDVKFPSAGGFPSTGGIYVVRPDQWEAFGGADEAFIGWGGEDDQTVAAATALIGLHRHPGVAVSLGHVGERLANPNYAANMLRVRAYQAAPSPSEMRQLLTRRASIVDDARREPAPMAVIAPSRGRPANVERLFKSIQETALLPVDLIVGLDEDDAEKYPRLPGVQYVVRPRRRLNAWWNELALANIDRYDAFLFAGDDNVMITPGWDFLLADELRQRNGAGFATGPDGLRKDKAFTWAAISSRQVRELGFVGPAGLIHLCIDTAWQYLAQATGTMYWIDHVLIEHLHYSRKGAGIVEDETYRQANAIEVNRSDRQTVEDWKRSPAFATAVAKIRNLLATPWIKVEGRPASSSNIIRMPWSLTIGSVVVKTGVVDVPLDVSITEGTLRLEAPADLANLVLGAP